MKYVKFFLIHRPDLFRTGYQNQAISNLEQGQVCEGSAAHLHQNSGEDTPPSPLGFEPAASCAIFFSNQLNVQQYMY